MLLPETGRGQDAIEGMHPHVVDEGLAGLLQAEPHLIDRILVAITEGLSITESGRLGVMDLRNGDRGIGLERIGLVSVIGDAQIILKQSDHAIDRALVATGHDTKPLAGRIEQEAILAGLAGGFANDDIVRAIFRARIQDGQRSATDPLHEILEQSGRLTAWLTLRRHDNPGDRFSLAGDRDLGIHGKTGASERPQPTGLFQ